MGSQLSGYFGPIDPRFKAIALEIERQFMFGKKKEPLHLIIFEDVLGRKPTKEEKQKILEWYNEMDLRRIEKEVEMYGNYVVISQWDNGRLLAQLVTAGDKETAVRGKQAHLDATSKQANNRVVAVSERPIQAVPSGTNPHNQRWASVPLVQVALEEVPPPPPPKEVKVKSTYTTAFNLGGAGARSLINRGHAHDFYEDEPY